MITVSHKDIFETASLTVRAKAIGSTVIIPHLCNNVDLFGAGFANAVAKKYPEVKDNYHLLGKKFLMSHPGYVQFVTVDREPEYHRELIVANMIAQNGVRSKRNPRPINYALLVKSMVEVKKYILTNCKNGAEIHCPKFGSGLAGGNWQFINYLIEDVWSDMKVVVYSYSHNSNQNRISNQEGLSH